MQFLTPRWLTRCGFNEPHRQCTQKHASNPALARKQSRIVPPKPQAHILPPGECTRVCTLYKLYVSSKSFAARPSHGQSLDRSRGHCSLHAHFSKRCAPLALHPTCASPRHALVTSCPSSLVELLLHDEQQQCTVAFADWLAICVLLSQRSSF